MKCQLIFFITGVISFSGACQSVYLKGKLDSKISSNIENIHVINKTSQQFTITNNKGEFVIPVELHDTLSLSSIQYKQKEIIISEDILKSKHIVIELEEHINQLEEVIIGQVLSGDLMFDIQSTKGKAPVNFYDLGIPGYTGKLATQNERRLQAAHGDGLKAKVLIPQILSGSVPIDPIINAINGWTKTLKHRVEVESKQELINGIKARLANSFFQSNPLEDDFKMDYFYFCIEDDTFLEKCKNKSDLEVLIFLKQKYDQYIMNRAEKN